MKELLKHFPYLTHLEVECQSSDIDLCNGNRWKSFILKELPHLTIFYFTFKLSSMSFLPWIIKNILCSYSTSFWLKEKRWFIAIEPERHLIYSVPRFSREDTIAVFRPPNLFMSLDNSILYNHINPHSVYKESIHHLRNVKELKFFYSRSVKLNTVIDAIIDVNRVECLSFINHDIPMKIFISLILQMKN
jgi:hypothetical protein